MGTKALLLVGCFLAFVLFISSEVAARDLAETNTVDTSTGAEAAVGDEKYSGGGNYNGGGGNYNGGGGNYNGGGGRYNGGGGRYNGGGGRYNGGGHGGGGGGYCRYGCCGGRYNRGGCRCCTFAGEKVDAATP